ncbi:hypothetical protein KJ765_04535, partial [Candidatus Micrarchaeota archaeon]|nr:hypothetical protein [Candidatus Micrarchaeota archaeon]
MLSHSVHAYDNYPWIHTIFHTFYTDFTTTDAYFIANHYDVALGNLANIGGTIKTRNPDVKTYLFVGLTYFSDGHQTKYDQFIADSDYTLAEAETAYMHYKCDVTYRGTDFPGCNLEDPVTLKCTGTPATGCESSGSSASWLWEARVPNWAPSNYLVWKSPHYPSEPYREFSIWRVQEIISYWGASPPDGVFYDNVLVMRGRTPYGDKTIEYWGIPMPDSDYEQYIRDQDHRDYFDYIANELDAREGRSYERFGNGNNMFYLQPDFPYVSWMLSALDFLDAEEWVATNVGQPEISMPWWHSKACRDMKNSWTISATNNKPLHVDTQNYPYSDWTRVFSLVKYYLVFNPNLYYSIWEGADESFSSNVYDYYNPMVEINIGTPIINPPGVRDFEGQFGTNKFFSWNHPDSGISCTTFDYQRMVVARHFSNGLVLGRWKALKECSPPSSTDPRCNSFVDPQVYGLANPYGNSYYVVQADGSLSLSPVSEITLRTNEAAILLLECKEGEVGAGNACGCGGVYLTENAWCCSGQQKIVCESDFECSLYGPDFVCENPGTCQAECVESQGSPSPIVEACEDLGGQCLDDCSERDDCSLDESGYCGVGVCCLGVCTATATPTVTITPTPEPCAVEGEAEVCDVSGCGGTRVCGSGFWSVCVKNDLCCGVSCDDGNSCTSDSCSDGACSHANICGDGGNDGGNNGGYTGGTTGTSTPTTAPTPTSGTGTDTPSPTVDWQGFEPEVQEQ